MPYNASVRTLPVHYRSRLKYENFDIKDISMEALDAMVRERCDVGLADVYAYHFSPDCSTYTTADKGRNGNRNADGSARSDKATAQDANVIRTLNVLRQISLKYPTQLITCENPATGYFHQLPIVQQLQQEGWQLTEVDYCAAANPQLDYDVVWPKKPTHILSHALPSQLELPLCNKQCPFRFSEESGNSHAHRKAIRIDHNSTPGQTRVEGYLRAAIPQGLFQIFDRAHQFWLCEKADKILTRKTRYPDLHHNEQTFSEIGMLVCQCCQHFDVNNLEADKHADKFNPNPVKDMTPSQKWWLLQHARYGHAGYKRMRSVLKHKHLPNLKFSDMHCKACAEAKACRKAHSGKLPRASYAMQLIHTDLQGPFQVPDLDGNYYQAIMVDDYTNRKWSLILRTKDEYGPKLKEWLASLHTPPETIRCDFGGDFC